MVQRPPVIDMRPDGSFPPPPRPTALFTTKVALGAMAVVLVGGSLAVAALAVWLLSLILPALVLAAGVAYVAWKLRAWQLRRAPPPGSVRRF